MKNALPFLYGELNMGMPLLLDFLAVDDGRRSDRFSCEDVTEACLERGIVAVAEANVRPALCRELFEDELDMPPVCNWRRYVASRELNS